MQRLREEIAKSRNGLCEKLRLIEQGERDIHI
jgi:hypothetical protein